jgi:hypothetical protein
MRILGTNHTSQSNDGDQHQKSILVVHIIPAVVNMKMSMIRQTKTRPTNIWKEPMFFLPMAVPVHGQLLTTVRIRKDVTMSVRCTLKADK